VVWLVAKFGNCSLHSLFELDRHTSFAIDDARDSFEADVGKGSDRADNVVSLASNNASPTSFGTKSMVAVHTLPDGRVSTRPSFVDLPYVRSTKTSTYYSEPYTH